MYRVIRGIALEDLGEAFLDWNPATGGARRHVDQCEDIQLVLVWLRELCQGIGEAAFLGLEPCPRVVCDQGNDLRRRILSREPPRTVDWMEARGCD